MLTLIPSGRGVNTQEERTRDWVEKRGMWDLCLSTLSFIPSVCDQPVPGSRREIPLNQPLNHRLHLTWLFLLPCPLFPLFDSSPLSSMSVSPTPLFAPCRLDLTHPSPNPLLLSTLSSFQLSRQWLTCKFQGALIRLLNFFSPCKSILRQKWKD